MTESVYLVGGLGGVLGEVRWKIGVDDVKGGGAYLEGV